MWEREGGGLVVLLGARAGSVCFDMEEWKGTQFDFVLTHDGKRMSISGLFFSCSGDLELSRLMEGKISATRRLGGESWRLSNCAWVVPCVVWWGMSQQQVRSRSARGLAGRARESD